MMSTQMSYRQALEEVAGLLAGRWVPAVLTALAGGPLRYTDLLAEINDAEPQVSQKAVTEKVLTDTLRLLERAQLIANRRQSAAFGASSFYELTAHGKTLLQALRPAIKWAMNYVADTDQTEPPD